VTRARRAKISVYRSNDEHVDLDEGFEGLLESLPADSARALIHILDCPDCQDAALALNSEAVESRAEEKPPISEQIEALLAELLAIPQDQRADAMKDPRFRRMELLDRVLDEAAAACDIVYSGYLAALAIWLGGMTEPREAPPRLVRAFCLHANVQRLSGKLDAAEKSLGSAACFLSGKPEEVGLYSRILALLRWEQGRLQDAAALLRHGSHAFGELKRRTDQGVCLVLLGLVYVEAGEMKRATAPLLRGLTSPGGRPPSRLSVCGSLSLALAAALLGWKKEAREAREQAWLFHAPPEAAAQPEVSWLAGRVAGALNETREASRLLDAARVQLLSVGRIAEAALASLDLAGLYAESGRSKEIGRLAAELEEAGAQSPVSELAAGALRDYVESKPSVANAFEQAAVRAASLRRTVRLRFPGLQTLPWT
jgi:hypothetical protein